MHIKSFGKIAEITGASWEAPPFPSIEALVAYAEATFPALKGMKYMVAVNRRVVQEGASIPEGSEIALLPPFSGG